MFGEQQQAAPDTPAAEDEHDEPQGSDADFDAGFNGDTEPTPTPAPTPAPSPEPTPAPTPAPEYVQLTKQDFERINAAAGRIDEISGTVKKQFDTAFGQMGALKQMVGKLQTETPAGEAVQVSDADFEELAQEYGPEMAALTAKGLNKILGRMKGAGGIDTDAVTKLVGEKIQAASQEIRAQTVEASLEAVFPGWKEEVKTPAFATWINSQAADVKALASSDKVGDAAKMLRLFDKAKSAPAPTPAPSNTRQRQIAAAVPPRGDGGHPPAPEDDDDFNAGFNYRSRSG